ncbi:MFS transporter [Kitasatospora sp. NPDC002522]
MSASSRNGSLSGNRDFRLLWVGGLMTALGSQLTAIALPLLVLRETGSAVQAGAVGSVAVAALLVSMLPAGALADAVERRRLMLWCDVGSAAVVGSLAVAVLLGHSPLALVMLVAVANAAISSLVGPAALGLLRAVVPADRLAAASARLQARSSAARLIGPLVGGALFAVHPALPFAAEAAGLLLCVACLAGVRTRSAPGPSAGSPFSRREFTAGIAFLWGRPFLRTVLLVFGLGMNAAFSALMFVSLAAASDGGRSGVGGGTVVSLTSAGALAGALLAPRVPARLRPGLLIAGTCWACAAAAGLMTLSQGVWYLGLLSGLSLALATVAGIGFNSSLLLASPEHMVGRVQSAAGLLSSLVQPLGPLAGGALFAAWGPAPAYGVLGAVFLVCAVLVSAARSEPRGAPAAARPEEPEARDAAPWSAAREQPLA